MMNLKDFTAQMLINYAVDEISHKHGLNTETATKTIFKNSLYVDLVKMTCHKFIYANLALFCNNDLNEVPNFREYVDNSINEIAEDYI